jgi:hypothetical protein
MAEGASRNAGLLWITAGIGHTTDAKEPKWLTDRLLSGDAELPLWVETSRSRQAGNGQKQPLALAALDIFGDRTVEKRRGVLGYQHR